MALHEICSKLTARRLLGVLQRTGVRAGSEGVPLRLLARPGPVAVNAAVLSFLARSLCLLNSFLPQNGKTKGKSRERKLGREGIIVPGLAVTADIQRNPGVEVLWADQLP